MKSNFSPVYLLIFFGICTIFFHESSANPGDVLWQACKNVTTQFGPIPNACVTLTESTNCGVNISLSVAGEKIFEQNAKSGVAPEVCGSKQGVEFCVVIQDSDSANKCVVINLSYSGYPLSPIEAGCFPNSVLANVLACESSQCPNQCSGHGTCQNQVCNCDSGYFEDDCSSSEAPILDQCRRVNQLSADVCVRVTFSGPSCEVNLAIVMVTGTIEAPLYTKSYSIHQFKAIFQAGICVDQSICSLCLNWTDLVLNESQASGCLSTSLTCPLGANYAANFGCFQNNDVMPACFGKCPNDCSNRGTCEQGTCNCNAGWGGDDCSTVNNCPNRCSQHGTCNNGRCSCDAGYSGGDCSGTKPTSSASSTGQIASSTSSFPLFPVVLVGLATVAIVAAIVAFVFWFQKKRARTEPQFSQLEMDEEDASLVQDTFDVENTSKD